jgi:hypothetical protein
MPDDPDAALHDPEFLQCLQQDPQDYRFAAARAHGVFTEEQRWLEIGDLAVARLRGPLGRDDGQIG